MMSPRLSRRRFVIAGTVLAGGVAPRAGAMLAATQGDDLSASRFRRHLGVSFTVNALSSTDARPATLVLREVRPLARTAPNLRPEVAQERSFELVFATEATGLAQATYEIANPGFGKFVALLVPARDGRQLTAIFNRLS